MTFTSRNPPSAARSAASSNNWVPACWTARRKAPGLPRPGKSSSPGAKALLRSAAQAAAATQAAARPSRISIGYTTGLIITPVVRQLRHQHPDADVQTLHLAWNEPRDALLGHRVDAVVTRLPIRTDGLHVTILYDEPRVLLVAADHRLAGKESVTLDDIADEPMPRLPDPAWNAYWRIDPRPDGRPAPGWPPHRGPGRTSSSSSPPGRPWPSPQLAFGPISSTPTSRRFPCTVSTRSTSSWPPARTIAAASYRPSANTPMPISPVPAPPGPVTERISALAADPAAEDDPVEEFMLLGHGNCWMRAAGGTAVTRQMRKASILAYLE